MEFPILNPKKPAAEESAGIAASDTSAMATRRKRLLYQARHRGTKEADRLFGGFVERHIAELDPASLDQLEALIAEDDADLMDWLSGRTAPPDGVRGALLQALVEYKIMVSGR